MISFSPPKNLWRDGGTHIWVALAHMSYKDITPPRNWRHKKCIWSWWRSRRSMTHGKRIPRILTKERPNMAPLDAIWLITFRRPDRTMTQNGSVSSILGQDMFSPIKNDQQAYTRPSFVTLALFTIRSRWRKHVVISS